MKKLLMLMMGLIIFFPAQAGAEKFLTIPIMPGAKIIQKTDKRLKFTIPKSHDQVLDFYKKAVKQYSDIKIREWERSTNIEDEGNLVWHSISISKGKGKETSVVIDKLTWTWIAATLFLRFIGVFVVLLVLFVALAILGALVSRALKRLEQKKALAKT